MMTELGEIQGRNSAEWLGDVCLEQSRHKPGSEEQPQFGLYANFIYKVEGCQTVDDTSRLTIPSHPEPSMRPGVSTAPKGPPAIGISGRAEPQ